MAKPIASFKGEGGGWRIKITTASGTEIFSQEQLQKHRGEHSRGARFLIRFHFPFDISSDSNTGDFWIYNPGRQLITEFKRHDLVKIEAGYAPFEDHKELLLEGTIEDIIVDTVSPTTHMLHVRVGDTTDIWPMCLASERYSPGVKASTVATDLIEKKLELPIGKIDPKEDPKYEKGLSIVGAVRPELEMVVRDMRSKLHVSRRMVYITYPNKGIPSGVTLTPDNGLFKIKPTLGIAENMEYIAELTDYEHPMLYEIIALLTPALWSDSEFTVESKEVNLDLRALRGSHDCNGKSFITSIWAAEQ
jgi:hypothetical protein